MRTWGIYCLLNFRLRVSFRHEPPPEVRVTWSFDLRLSFSSFFSVTVFSYLSRRLYENTNNSCMLSIGIIVLLIATTWRSTCTCWQNKEKILKITKNWKICGSRRHYTVPVRPIYGLKYWWVYDSNKLFCNL